MICVIGGVIVGVVGIVNICIDRCVDAEVSSADEIKFGIDYEYNMGSYDVFSDGSNYVQTCGFNNILSTWI